MRQLATALVTALVLLGALTGPASAAVLTGTHTTGAQTTNDHLEPNDSIQNASELINADGELQIVSGEYDYFELYLTEGERLSVSLDFSHSQGDLDLRVLAPNGTRVAGSFSVTSGERVTFTASSAGNYHVAVNGYAGASAPYYISHAIENNDRFEHNDGMTRSTNVSTGFYDNLDIVGGESDFYAIHLQNGTTLDAAIEFDHSQGDLDMAVHDPSGLQFNGSDSLTDDESVSFTASQTGTYYVEVYGHHFNAATNDYNLTLSSPDASMDDRLEDNDIFGDAASASQYHYEDLQVTSNDQDYYTVSLQRGEHFEAEFDFDHSAGDLDVVVSDPQRGFVDSSNSITDDEQVAFTAEQSGTYYIRVRGYNGATNAYDMSMWKQNDRFELNGWFDSATQLSSGDYDDLRIESGESDYVAVQLQQGDQLNASAVFDHSTGDLDMTVYGPNQNQVGSSASITDDESVVVTAQQSGTYYVEVYGYAGATAPYDLSLDVN